MEHVDVLIIGAGISGIGAACHLRTKCPDRSFAILEGRDAIGGTWDLFRYPDPLDSDMFTFGYSFKPWVEDQDIATGESILRYLNETVDEYDLDKDIRFRHRVQKVRWSAERRAWIATVHRDEDDTTFQMSATFLLTCTGYYNYDQGYLPKFEGWEDYRGVVAHPQHWPEDLDYAGKRVLVIGSGATAVTIVPSMAKTAGHVTMLQRSPTYIFSRPGEDAIAKKLREWLPQRVAYGLSRAKNVAMGTLVYQLSRRRPEKVRSFLRNMAVERVGPDVDVDVHFNPSYDPWDQRLCLIPDDDLYEALREGDASIVTDTIERFTETGVRLTSGETIEADIVVPATGLQLQFFGGMTMEIDGEEVETSELVSYRGLMFGNMPNWVHVVGYTNASWTLKADLTSEFVCRLLNHMKDEGYDVAVPRLEEPPAHTRPIMDSLKSGYIKRGADQMPRQADSGPWRNSDNYLRDLIRVGKARLDDGILTFERSRASSRPKRFRFRGKTAVVTGAASGIGEALAKDLAGRGCHLALVDVNAEGLEHVARAARARGVHVSTHVLDMGDADAIRAFPDELRQAHDVVDLLINNAGVALGGHFEEVSDDDFEWLMNINFYGVVRMTRALLPLLRERPDAHIANVSSVLGMITPPGQAAYASSKFAVRGFSEVLRRELADSTVGISVIHPGGIKTNIARSARIPEGLANDEEHKRAVEEFEKTFITTPEKAADIILAGIERRRARIMVGPDARLIEVVERLFPLKNLEVLAKLLGLEEPARKRIVPDEPEASVDAHDVPVTGPVVQA